MRLAEISERHNSTELQNCVLELHNLGRKNNEYMQLTAALGSSLLEAQRRAQFELAVLRDDYDRKERATNRTITNLYAQLHTVKGQLGYLSREIEAKDKLLENAGVKVEKVKPRNMEHIEVV